MGLNVHFEDDKLVFLFLLLRTRLSVNGSDIGHPVFELLLWRPVSCFETCCAICDFTPGNRELLLSLLLHCTATVPDPFCAQGTPKLHHPFFHILSSKGGSPEQPELGYFMGQAVVSTTGSLSLYGSPISSGTGTLFYDLKPILAMRHEIPVILRESL